MIEKVSFNNAFIKYLCTFIWFDQDRLTDLLTRYFIGATENGEPIFWHIDADHRITNGLVITMSGDTGEVYGRCRYFQDNRKTCLFGEHLLKDFPTQTVALVREEITAAVMSCFPTPYVWLATGKNELISTDLEPLKGRKIVVFPDKGEYRWWQDNMWKLSHLNYHISDVMEKMQCNDNSIDRVMLSKQTLRPTEEEAALIRLTGAIPHISLLVEKLGLEVVSVTKSESPKSKTRTTVEDTKQDASTKAKAGKAVENFRKEQINRWHGMNPDCYQCDFSHESINGTFCDRLRRYVEYRKGNCCVDIKTGGSED